MRYKDDVGVKPLCITLPKMSKYVKNFDETRAYVKKASTHFINEYHFSRNYRNQQMRYQIKGIIEYINFGNQFHYEKYNQKLRNVEYYNGK